MTQPKSTMSGDIAAPNTGAWKGRTQFFCALANVGWAFMDVYAVGIVAFLAIRLVIHERLGVIALLDNAIHWALLPSLAFTALALWRKRYRRLALYAVVGTAFLFAFGELFLPSIPASTGCPDDRPDCLTKLRVMQVNLFNDHFDPNIMLPVLRNSGADIIAVEEFSVGPAAVIKQNLSDVYPYQVQFEDNIFGVGLLSKYPIVSTQLIFVGDHPFLKHLMATLDVNGRPLIVVVAHPPPPAVDRVGMVPVYTTRGGPDVQMLAQIGSTGDAVLMPGDFNFSDQSDEYHMMTSTGMKDAFREAGWGFGSTWPVGFVVPPLLRIDYIWMSWQFDATAAWLGEANTSDHYPVYADLIWRH